MAVLTPLPEKQGLKPAVSVSLLIPRLCINATSRKTRIETVLCLLSGLIVFGINATSRKTRIETHF